MLLLHTIKESICSIISGIKTYIMQNKIAILFGATGLTGNHVLNKLVKDNRYDKIKVFTRSEPEIRSDKIEIIKTPLEKLDKHADQIAGHDIFCCLGTTIKKAGSREKFRMVDYQFPVTIAEIASKNKIPAYLLISSIGADPGSSNFYLRTKGEVEKAIQQFKFERIIILRPSMLLGKRDEFRFMEEAGKLIMSPLRFVLKGKFKKYRAIHAKTVAKAMVNLANTHFVKSIFESDEIEVYSKEIPEQNRSQN